MTSTRETNYSSDIVEYFSTIHDINRISHALVQRVFDAKQVDISSEQWKTLGIIYDSQPITPIELSRQTFKNKGAVARVLAGLEKRELIKRLPTRKQNSYQVALTDKGDEILQQAYDLGHETLAWLTKDISEPELSQAFEVLQRTLNAMTNELE
ncbi:MarR family transcriptional regulator [Shewanella maritima]|uniref:MarR family transcriptional regulator n=1 Tax=Shewanella maritima TaxID=2520507 RepID=A0A411PGM6_9GAMM|nr:MarR family transcriptional regulator [Shewanella maritima]QBF82746.1 MarR family transcriptional regulator [Shewanella maritima]